jgi:diguanylate cyclase (GGDEF)-like protein/PAS domain S-box-containing protein
MAGRALKDTTAQLLQFPQSENLLRTIMESAAVGMVLVGSDGSITYANRAYGEMFRCRPEDCIGLSARELVVPEERLVAAEQVRKLIDGEIEQYRVERRFLRRDGSGSFWGLASAALLRHETTGLPFSIVIQVTDIDRQKQAEAALVDAEGRWNFALEGAGQGVWDHDMVNKRAFFSRTWKTMRGYEPDEEVDGSYEAWIQRIHPDDRPRIIDTVRRQDAGEIPYNAFEYRERRKDGGWVWILSRGKPVEWMPDGSPARVIGTDTDITALKETETALAEERETLKVTLESIADGVISTDARGLVSFINPVAAQMTGWLPEAALGQPVEKVFRLVDEAGEPLPNPVADCIARGKRRQIDEDAVALTRFGRRIDVRSSVSLIKAPGNGIFGAVLVFQDVSRSRAVQRELAHSATHDSLTGLPNRSAFERKLHEMLEQARKEGSEHALCFIDLDHFEPVNDKAGHAAGDALLREVAAVLRAGQRRGDFPARIGGDEFALILPDCPTGAAVRIAGEIVAKVGGIAFEWQGASYRIGASVGVTAVGPDAVDVPSLMAEADTACYAAKAKGRNRVEVAGPRHEDSGARAVLADALAAETDTPTRKD